MADKKISDLVDGNTLRVSDLMLAVRGTKNVHLKGSLMVASLDYRPPTVAAFDAVGVTLSDSERGLLFADPVQDSSSATSWATREIPQENLGSFSYVAHIQYNGAGKIGSVAGVCVRTASGKMAAIGRGWGWAGQSLHSPVGFIAANNSYATNQGSECRWFRITVSGTTVNLSFSDEGVNWNLYASADIGEPVTEYGVMIQRNGYGSSPARCDYFDSTEFPNQRW